MSKRRHIDEKESISINNLLLDDNNFIIGEGTTSTVYSNKDNEGNDTAIKVLEFNEKTFEETSTYQWLKKHNCEHLIKIIDIKVISNSIHIKMQRYDGTLSDLIKFQHCFPENILKLITYQMCIGLNYLHERQMLHGDLHAENVFYKDLIFNPLTKEIENIHIVIGDLGETENKNSFSIENDDMTNLGCILLQLITKDVKASPCNEIEFENYFIKNNCISNEFKNFVKNLILNNKKQIVPKEIVFAYKSDEWSDLCDDNFPIIENKIIPNELIYFSDYDSIKAYIYKRYLNIITIYELTCLVLQNNQLFKPNYEYQVTSLNTKKGYINIKPKRLIFNNTKIETEFIPEPVKCKITISHSKQFIDTICESEFVFLPNNQASNFTDMLLVQDYNTMHYYQSSSTNSPTSSSSGGNSSNYSPNTDNNNSPIEEGSMSFNEFKYKINNYSEEYFNELAVLNKCPLGFPILSHFAARGMKRECEKLIEMGKDPNEIDSLGKTALYWADYFRLENGGLDREWLLEKYYSINMSISFNHYQNLQNDFNNQNLNNTTISPYEQKSVNSQLISLSQTQMNQQSYNQQQQYYNCNNNEMNNSQLNFNPQLLTPFLNKENKKKEKPITQKIKCKDWDKCKKTNNCEHAEKYYHPCRHGSNCKYQENETHRNRFAHPCKFGSKCKNKDKEHKIYFSH